MGEEESDIKTIVRRLDEINAALGDLKVVNAATQGRIACLERARSPRRHGFEGLGFRSFQNGGGHVDNNDISQEPAVDARDSRSHLPEAAAPGPTSSLGATEEDIQSNFQSIKDSLSKVRLAADLRLNESRAGIQRNDQTAFNVLTKSARYVETSLKLLGSLSDGNVSEDNLASLFTIQLAHMRYLQDDFAALVVQGTFDKETTRLFRCFQKNTSGLTPTAIANLRSAAEISGARNHSTNNMQRGRGYQQWRGRGRGESSFGGYRNYGNRQFPQHRYDNRNDTTNPPSTGD